MFHALADPVPSRRLHEKFFGLDPRNLAFSRSHENAFFISALSRLYSNEHHATSSKDRETLLHYLSRSRDIVKKLYRVIAIILRNGSAKELIFHLRFVN